MLAITFLKTLFLLIEINLQKLISLKVANFLFSYLMYYKSLFLFLILLLFPLYYLYLNT